MNDALTLQALSAIRALSPLLFALLSLFVIPIVRSDRFGSKRDAHVRGGSAAVALLLLSSVAALLAGSGYGSTLNAGLITVDPSEPGRLLVTLGGAVFALIVAVGQGRRAGAMGQVALFGLALIDLALAIPIGLAPITLLLVGSASLSALAAGDKEDAQRARAVFRDLRTVGVLLTVTVMAELLRSAIPLSATDPSYATTSSLTAGVALTLSLVLLGMIGAFPFHHRLVRIFESLPIVGSLMVGVWIPAALSLIILNELSLLSSSVSEPIGGAVVAALFITGIVTILFGGVSALLHDDVGEVLGFLAVGNAGWLALGAAAIILHPSAVGPLLVALPGALVISLFGLWRISIRRHYELTSLQELSGWARRTRALSVVLICAAISQTAVPAREFFSGGFDIAGQSGGLLITLGALLGAGTLAAAAIRLLLVGLAQESQDVHLTRKGKVLSPAAIWLMAGAILISGVAAGLINIEAAASGLLRPDPVESVPQNSTP
jgi:formate hydrogenlyase subunit 3/multisubunit Na+/H+ antiporter MnhD subunit